jgi:hypothetical protein
MSRDLDVGPGRLQKNHLAAGYLTERETTASGNSWMRETCQVSRFEPGFGSRDNV